MQSRFFANHARQTQSQRSGQLQRICCYSSPVILLTVALVLTGLTVWGLVTSREQRAIDWRYYSAFVGFVAAVLASTGTALAVVTTSFRGHASPYTMSPLLQVFTAVDSIMVFTSIPITFFAGLFSRGIQRIALVSSAIVVSLVLLFTIAAHFGD